MRGGQEGEQQQQQHQQVAPLCARWSPFPMAIKPSTLAKLALWAALQLLFMRWEFGLVFFIASCFYWVWDSMGTPSSSSSSSQTPGQDRAPSAYSVFNPGVTALPGTLNASEFDGIMRGGGLAAAPPERNSLSSSSSSSSGQQQKRTRAARQGDEREVVEEEEADDEDEVMQRAAWASLRHRKPSRKRKEGTQQSHSQEELLLSGSRDRPAARALVMDSDLQVLLRSVRK